jgi:predicted membrane protein
MEGQRVKKIWEPIDFTIYFKFIRWPVLIALILEIAFRYFANSLGSGLLFDQMELASWFIRIIAFGVIARRSIKSFGYSTAIAAISGILGGFVIGIVVALYRFTDGINFWKFFNIITETTTVVVVGSLVAIFVVYVSNLKK